MKYVLCADSESLRHPEIIGLEGECLEGLSWLSLFASASEARCALAETKGVEEVWVISSDEMDAINLAAALKFDSPDTRVLLVSSQMTGSSLSRAQAAGLNGTISPRAFALRYAQEKKKHAEDAPQLSPCPDARPKLPLVEDDVNESDFLPEGGRPGLSRSAFSLCVLGAGGGVGTSTAALLSAHILAQREMSVLLVDADLRFGSLASISEADGLLSLSELIDKPSMADGLARAGKVVCLTSPERMELAERLGEALPAAIDAASQHFDAVVVDVGGPFADLHMTLVEQCAQTLVLIGQRSSSIRACKRILDVFQRCGAATNSLVVAVNGCSKGSMFSSVDASCLLRGIKVVELRDGGRLVEELMGVGAATSLISEGNPFASSLSRLMCEMLPEGSACAGQEDRGLSIRLFGEGLRARKAFKSQKRGETREHDAA